MNQIKCGRKTYDLEDGDTVMDNGACLHLVTRKISKGWDTLTPRVSKAEFKRFKAMPEVKINDDHNYDKSVTLYRYHAS